MAVVGFVDNKDIKPETGITPGEGGGYFIIKNSNGKCFGDMGFLYAPYEWVKKWGIGMIAITDVQLV